MKKILISTLLFPFFGIQLYSISGNLDASIRWDLNETTGELRISGAGAIPFDHQTHVPWRDNSLSPLIKSAVIGEGITNTGRYTFNLCRNLTSVTLPNSLEVIGDEMFVDTKIKSPVIPRNVKALEGQAFGDV